MRGREIDVAIFTVCPSVTLQYKTVVTYCHAMVSNLYLLTKQIGAIMPPVHNHFYKMRPRCPVKVTHLTKLERQSVAQHALIRIVRYEHPRLVLVFPQECNLFVELQPVRLLWLSPGTIATAFDMNRSRHDITCRPGSYILHQSQ